MKIGDKIINFKLQATNGESYSNYTFADKYALCIVFIDNNCQYSKAYWPRLLKLNDMYEEDNLAIIAINPVPTNQDAEDSISNMVELLKKYNHSNFIYLKDETQEVAKAYGATKTPEVFLFNSKRELVYTGCIDDNWENESQVMMAYLEDAIEYCLDGIDIDYPEMPGHGTEIVYNK